MTKLTNNSLALIAHANEFCQAVEGAREAERTEFVRSMLRLLPRIYIAASDIPAPVTESDGYIAPALDEDYYDAMRRAVEALLGEDDTYLDVFQEDMKYSDTPIAASIAEGVADLFQVLYNFVEAVREAPTELVTEAVDALREDFVHYWSRTLCNVLRALNAVQTESADY